MLKRGKETDAVTQVVSFIVAGAFFLGILGALLIATSDSSEADGTQIQDTQNRLDAEHLADLLAGSTGIGWAGGADSVTRIGLLHDDGDRLDNNRLSALRGAVYDADPNNGKIDYEEALDSMGIPNDGSVGFHLRMTPVGLQKQLLAADLSHIQTAYIGDWPNVALDYTVPLGTDLDMLTDVRAQIDVQIDILTGQERQIIDNLGLGFDDMIDLNNINIDVDLGLGVTVPIQTVLGDLGLLDGDVYLDQKQYLDSTLNSVLPGYDLLIVGSSVDQSSLTSAIVKQPISDWVVAGGTLMVMGSSAQNFQWLEPLFSVGTTTVNSAPAAPDVSHPILHEPHELDWPSYDNFGLAWDLKDQGAMASFDKFQHIITSDGEDILAVSNEGAFGDGRIFLTSFRPENIADTMDAIEAGNFLNNLVLYSDRAHLYLDYGPTPPDGAAVSAAVRTSQILDPDLGMVNIRMTVLYWGV